MHTLQDEMLVHRDALGPVLRRRAPSQEHDAIRPDLGHSVDDLLRQQLPALARMRVCFTPADSEAGIEQQDATICPWCEEATLVGRWLVFGVVDLECLVDVLEGWWCWCGWANGEAEAVGLVGAVVGVLACDDDFDSVKGRVSGPVGRCKLPLEVLKVTDWKRTTSTHPSWADTQSFHSSALASRTSSAQETVV